MENQNTFNNPEINQEARISPNEQLQQIVQSGENIEQATNLQQTPAQVKYAGFWIRYAAYVADSIIIVVILMCLIVLPFTIIYRLISPALGIVLTPILYGLAFIFALGYIIILTKKYQATLGKKIFGIAVLRSDFSEASWGRVILRETVGKIISGMIMNIGYIMAGFTEKKQGLHDMIADTVVVYKDPNKETKAWWIVVAVLLPIILVIGMLFASIFINLGNAKKAQENAKQRQINAQKQYEDEMNNSQQSSDVSSDINSKLWEDRIKAQEEAEMRMQQAAQQASNNDIVPNPSTAPASASDPNYSEQNLVRAVFSDMKDYYTKNKTYNSYVIDAENFKKKNWSNIIYTRISKVNIDIAPDGKSFVIYCPIESNTENSWCMENGMEDALIAKTSLIKSTYHCK